MSNIKYTKVKVAPKNATVKCIEWQITAELIKNEAEIKQVIEQKSCFVLATNIDEHLRVQLFFLYFHLLIQFLSVFCVNIVNEHFTRSVILYQ